MNQTRVTRWLVSEKALPYWLILPTLVWIAVFFLGPLAQAVLLAFRTGDGQWAMRFFVQMVKDVQFFDAFKFTLILVATIVPLQLVTALLIALLVNTRFRGSRSFLYICAIPLGISDLAAGLIWFSFSPSTGTSTPFCALWG